MAIPDPGDGAVAAGVTTATRTTPRSVRPVAAGVTVAAVMAAAVTPAAVMAAAVMPAAVMVAAAMAAAAGPRRRLRWMARW